MCVGCLPFWRGEVNPFISIKKKKKKKNSTVAMFNQDMCCESGIGKRNNYGESRGKRVK